MLRKMKTSSRVAKAIAFTRQSKTFGHKPLFKILIVNVLRNNPNDLNDPNDQ